MATQHETEQLIIQAGLAPPRIAMLSLGGPFAWLHHRPTTPDDVARILLETAEHSGVRLGTWLGTEDGEVMTAAVRATIPPYLKPEFTLLVEGLKLAAKVQQQRGHEKLAAPIVVGVLLIALLAVGRVFIRK